MMLQQQTYLGGGPSPGASSSSSSDLVIPQSAHRKRAPQKSPRAPAKRQTRSQAELVFRDNKGSSTTRESVVTAGAPDGPLPAPWRARYASGTSALHSANGETSPSSATSSIEYYFFEFSSSSTRVYDSIAYSYLITLR